MWQRLEQDTADDAEDRRVRADPERKRNDDDGGECRAMTQRSNAVPNISRDTFEPRQTALIAHGFCREGQPTRGEHRLSSGRLRMHASPNVLGGLHLEVRLQLVSQIVVGAASGEHAGDTRERGADVSHGVSGFGERNAAIKSAV
jgi:hypothetical protein